MWGVSDALSSTIRLVEQNADLGFCDGWLNLARNVDVKVLCNVSP